MEVESNIDYPKVQFKGDDRAFWYVVGEEDDNYILVFEEKLDHWKNAKNKIERREYYEDIIEKSEFKPYTKMRSGGSIKGKGTFNQLGSAKELGITPEIKEHDMVGMCDCGERFSYKNSKKDLLWKCPECSGMKRIVTL